MSWEDLSSHFAAFEILLANALVELPANSATDQLRPSCLIPPVANARRDLQQHLFLRGATPGETMPQVFPTHTKQVSARKAITLLSPRPVICTWCDCEMCAYGYNSNADDWLLQQHSHTSIDINLTWGIWNLVRTRNRKCKFDTNAMNHQCSCAIGQSCEGRSVRDFGARGCSRRRMSKYQRLYLVVNA